MRVIAVLFSLLFATSATAEETASRFCVVPVKDGAPGEADVNSTWRIVGGHTFLIPGLPGPIFTPTNRQGAWTIDIDRRLVPYQGPFPRNYLDAQNWVVEPWSGRVIAATRREGIATAEPGAGRLSITDARPAGGRPQAIPRQTRTLLANGKGGIVVGDPAPWVSDVELAAAGIKGIASIHDAPLLEAMVVADTDRGVHVRGDAGAWHRVGSLERHDFVNSVYDLPGAGVTMVDAGKIVWALSRTASGRIATEVLRRGPANNVAHAFRRSRVFDQVLTFDAGGMFDSAKRWRRLEASGFVDIPGGDIDNNTSLPDGRIHDLTVLGRVLIEGRDRLHLYDGRELKPVAGSEALPAGRLRHVYDLLSIGRALIVADGGLWEVTADARLVRHPMPFGYAQLIDWTPSAVALANTSKGLFTLDATLNALPIPGGGHVGSSNFLVSFAGVSPGTGDVVIVGGRGLFLAVDTARNGDAACAEERARVARVPAGNLCLAPLLGTEPAILGDRVFQLLAAPGDGGLLLSSRRGLLHRGLDGQIALLLPGRESNPFQLLRLPWSDEVLAISFDTSLVRRDLSVERVVSGLLIEPIGLASSLKSALFKVRGRLSVLPVDEPKPILQHTAVFASASRAWADAPWLNGVLIADFDKFYRLDRHGQTEELSITGFKRFSSPSPSKLIALPRWKTILAAGNDGLFRITADLRWEPVEGWHRMGLLEAFDPPSGDVLLGTTTGLRALDAEGRSYGLTGGLQPKRTIRSIVAEQGADTLLAGGDEGLFRVDLANGRVQPVENGDAETIGAVSRLVPIPFARATIVVASNGSYVLEEAGLRSAPELSAIVPWAQILPMPSISTVYVDASVRGSTSDAERPLLQTLMRRDGDGHCRAPLTP